MFYFKFLFLFKILFLNEDFFFVFKDMEDRMNKYKIRGSFGELKIKLKSKNNKIKISERSEEDFSTRLKKLNILIYLSREKSDITKDNNRKK